MHQKYWPRLLSAFGVRCSRRDGHDRNSWSVHARIPHMFARRTRRVWSGDALRGRSRRNCRGANHVYSLAFSYYGMGTVLALQGDKSRSITVLEQGLEICRSWTLPLMLPLIGISLGYAYCLADRVDDAIVLLEETEREATKMNRVGGRAMILVRLGEAYLRRLRIADAERCGRRALMLSRKHGEYGHEAHALRLIAELGVREPSPP